MADIKFALSSLAKIPSGATGVSVSAPAFMLAQTLMSLQLRRLLLQEKPQISKLATCQVLYCHVMFCRVS